ncbi:hypothetical protein LJC44_07175 [Parabacteroides sp. OttesenSCG-928-G06]|nr:hypothetical protein [Parabacteroides sp. OttesenSCG-928-G06]
MDAFPVRRESKKLVFNHLIFCVMKVDYFFIPEITVSYKDPVKASERFTIKSSLDASKVFAEAFKDCMQHHEEIYALFLNRSGRVLGILCIGKGG